MQLLMLLASDYFQKFRNRKIKELLDIRTIERLGLGRLELLSCNLQKVCLHAQPLQH